MPRRRGRGCQRAWERQRRQTTIDCEEVSGHVSLSAGMMATWQVKGEAGRASGPGVRRHSQLGDGPRPGPRARPQAAAHVPQSDPPGPRRPSRRVFVWRLASRPLGFRRGALEGTSTLPIRSGCRYSQEAIRKDTIRNMFIRKMLFARMLFGDVGACLGWRCPSRH